MALRTKATRLMLIELQLLVFLRPFKDDGTMEPASTMSFLYCILATAMGMESLSDINSGDFAVPSVADGSAILSCNHMQLSCNALDEKG